MTTSPNPYRGFRFPPEVIEHAVWLYHCFSLSLRDVELILAARGIVVSYESIREWGLRFGQIFANMLKRRRPQTGDKWYMDEVFIRIRGKQHYLWRAVDQHGNVLDILVQRPAQCDGGQAVLPQIAEGLAIYSAGDRDGQAQELCRRQARDPTERRASSKPVSQQSRRGVAPADTTTRTTDEALQVSASRAALSLQPQSDPQPLPAPPSSAQCQRASCGSRRRLSHMA
jgi:DDE domain